LGFFPELSLEKSEGAKRAPAERPPAVLIKSLLFIITPQLNSRVNTLRQLII
jgi:hypothetical protein